MTRRAAGGVFAGIPSEELLTEWGFEEWHEPEPSEEELLERAMSATIASIEDYDNSENVNSFSINGIRGWIDRNTRVSLLHALDVVELNGGEQYTVWFEGASMTLPIATIRAFLNALELYAIEALNVTNSHIMGVRSLTSVEEVERYDITAGYPEKISIVVGA